ncbi:MAG: polysaccharide deacetylase family protein [Bacteroidales bacterium]
MKGFLTENKIEYVLFHLRMNFSIPMEIMEKFEFVTGTPELTSEKRIYFLLSDKSFNEKEIQYREGLPLFFPVLDRGGFYHIDKGNLIFHDDLIKAIFYLLSGYQELSPDSLDKMGRYPHKLSVQSKLNITRRPLVNYYFEIINKGLTEYGKSVGLLPERRKYFNDFCFFLSHDVDRIDTYTLYELGYKLKEVFGFVQSPFNRLKTIKLAIKFFLNWLNVINKKNPHWDFDYHLETENRFGVRSTFFFLPKGLLHQDAYYSFSEKRVKKLFKLIEKKQCEIGLHGTVRSAKQQHILNENLNEIGKYVKDIKGIRQHRLLYDVNVTPVFYHKAGLLYDTTLGFAEHEGFRNSYCLPFRLYDHKNDCMLNTWEIPLVVMDVSLFMYRKHDFASAMDSIRIILDEVKRFNGIFSLLWHNGNFDDTLNPGIRKFYENLLKDISEMNSESLTGSEIIGRVNEVNN